MRKFLLFILPLLFAVAAHAQLASGTYTISTNSNENPDYSSFSAAASALSAGISGEVIFEVAPGTYEEYVTINSISGTSSTNRVIFRGMGADNQQVVISSNAGYTTNSTLKLNGSNFVTFENMTITSTSSNNALLVKLTGGVDSARFENVRFVGIELTTSSYSSGDNDKNLVHMDAAEGVYCNGNEFVDCQFVNGHIALYLQGKNMYQFNDGVLVENCTFSNQHMKSIYISFYNNVIVRGNTINNSNDSYNNYNAIDAYQCYKACRFENNIMNVERTNYYTTVFMLRPCVGDSLDHAIVSNNIVNLNANTSSPSYCFRLSNNYTSFVDVAHNTFKCTGTGNVGNVHVENNGKNITFYNNLLVNETSGYVFRFNTLTLENRYSDYNRVSFTGDYFARRGTVDYETIQDWTDSTGLDENTTLCSPSFLSDNDLHITSNENLTVANPLSYVTVDIDGDTRAVMPCAGADEFAEGENLTPVVANPINNIFFNTFPASKEINISQVFDDPDDDNDAIEISILSNTNPTLVSATLVDTILTVERLLTTGGSSNITLLAISNGDSVQTSFTVTCIAEDLPPVVAEPIEPITFTTFPQTLSFDLSEVFDDPDNNNLFIEFDVEAMYDEVITYIDDEDFLVVTRKTINEVVDTLIVTATSNGKSVDMLVPVSGDAISVEIGVADFEDVEISANGHWTSGVEGAAQMVSNGWSFNNYDYSYFWGGFTASNATDTTLAGVPGQYVAVPGVGHDGSTNYAVSYAMGVPTVVSTVDGSAHSVTGFYVTNNIYAFKSMRDGDAYSTKFGGADGTTPDFFVLHAIGKDVNGNNTDTLDFYLADFRSDNSDEDYIVNSWEWFDLSSLGEVVSVSFTMESSQNDNWGMVTPAYFCMDDFNGVAPTTPIEPVEIGIADFEDVELTSNDHWTPSEEGYAQMSNNGWNFSAYSGTYYGYPVWGGFTASNATDTTLAGVPGQYVATPAQGHNGSEKFAVAYTMGYPTVVSTVDGSAHSVTGFYVTNNIYAFKSMRDGDAYSTKFGGTDGTTPDFLVLHAVGKDINGNNTDTLDFYLADFRSDNSDEDYIVNSWEWFDLSSLGEVVSVSFTMESSQNDDWGMVTPAYFCMDDFNGVAPIIVEDQAPYVVNPVADIVSNHFPETFNIDLNGVATDDDSPICEITYTLLSNSNNTAVVATIENNTLEVVRQNAYPANAVLTIRATSGDLYVDFTVNVILNDATGIADFAENTMIYPNPTNGIVNIIVPNVGEYSYTISNSLGQVIFNNKSFNEQEIVDLTSYSRGIYYLTIKTNDSQITKKIVVR